MHKFNLFLTLVLMSFSASYLHAEEKKGVLHTQKFLEGRHYTKLANPLPEGIATVTEFFYYGCTTCYTLSPLLAEWVQKTKVSFTLIPTHSETALVDAARIHHTFQIMGVMNKMYSESYRMIQEPNELQGADRINFYLKKNKVDKNEFWKTWNSKLVEQRLKSSAALTKQAQVFKTPTFIVYGVYKIDIESVTSVDQLIDLLNYLVAHKPSSAPVLLQKAS
jgi:protein dithiol oxidoreductase (disulfide-forming)